MPSSTGNYGRRQRLQRKHRSFCKPSPMHPSTTMSRRLSRSLAESPRRRSCREARTTRTARRRRARSRSGNSQNAKRGRSRSVKKNSAGTPRCGKGCSAPPRPTARRNGLRHLVAMAASSLEARAGVAEAVIEETRTPIPRRTSLLRVAKRPPSDTYMTLPTRLSRIHRTCRGSRTDHHDLAPERQGWISPFALLVVLTAAAGEGSALLREVVADPLHECYTVRRPKPRGRKPPRLGPTYGCKTSAAEFLQTTSTLRLERKIQFQRRNSQKYRSGRSLPSLPTQRSHYL